MKAEIPKVIKYVKEKIVDPIASKNDCYSWSEHIDTSKDVCRWIFKMTDGHEVVIRMDEPYHLFDCDIEAEYGVIVYWFKGDKDTFESKTICIGVVEDWVKRVFSHEILGEEVRSGHGVGRDKDATMYNY